MAKKSELAVLDTFKLTKETNKGGADYAKIVLNKSGLLPAGVVAQAKELRRQMKDKFKEMSIHAVEYNALQGNSLDISVDDGEVFPPPAGDVPTAPRFEGSAGDALRAYAPLPDDDNLPFA